LPVYLIAFLLSLALGYTFLFRSQVSAQPEFVQINQDI
jgi:hypothetical protein